MGDTAMDTVTVSDTTEDTDTDMVDMATTMARGRPMLRLSPLWCTVATPMLVLATTALPATPMPELAMPESPLSHLPWSPPPRLSPTRPTPPLWRPTLSPPTCPCPWLLEATRLWPETTVIWLELSMRFPPSLELPLSTPRSTLPARDP